MFRNDSVARRVIGLRRVFAELFALLPFNSWRCVAYRTLGYRITRSQIGFGTMIAVESLWIDRATMGRRNKIHGPFRLHMEQEAAIGSDNKIWCDFWPLDNEHKKFNYKREFWMERRSLLTNSHCIDVVDYIRIGAGSHIAGIGSQFWTHGHAGEDRDIDIGIDCFVGSRCIFLPGSGIADRSTLGAGSVVTKKHGRPFSFLSGNPAVLLRENYYWRRRECVDAQNPPDLPVGLIRDVAAGSEQ